MNHQPDTSPSHSKISEQTSQYVPQIQGGRGGVGKAEDRFKQNEYATQTKMQLKTKWSLKYQKQAHKWVYYLFRVIFAFVLIRTPI